MSFLDISVKKEVVRLVTRSMNATTIIHVQWLLVSTHQSTKVMWNFAQQVNLKILLFSSGAGIKSLAFWSVYVVHLLGVENDAQLKIMLASISSLMK